MHTHKLITNEDYDTLYGNDNLFDQGSDHESDTNEEKKDGVKANPPQNEGLIASNQI